MRRGIALLLVLAAAGCRDFATPSVSAFVTPGIYTPVDLGTLGGASSAATDVNASEQIVGHSVTATGETHAFLITDGVMQDLGTLGGTYSTADDINDAGQIAGRSTTAAGEMRAVLWTDGTLVDLGPLAFGEVRLSERGQVAWSAPTPDGSQAARWSEGLMEELGSLGGTTVWVKGINDRGEVVGTSTTAPGSSFRLAFIWRDGVLIGLAGFGGITLAEGVNAAGQVVGRAFAGSFGHAVLWEGEAMTDLGVLPGDVTATAIVINDLGWVAGQSYSSVWDDTPAPFLWRAGVMQPLDPGYQTSFNKQFVAAMNSLGLVVGREVVLNRIDHAKVWENGVVSDLPTLGGESGSAVAINNRGTVVGRAQDASGAFHAVVWRRLLSL